jgi:hypothetical protein
MIHQILPQTKNISPFFFKEKLNYSKPQNLNLNYTNTFFQYFIQV